MMPAPQKSYLLCIAVIFALGCDRTDELVEKSRSTDPETPTRFVTVDVSAKQIISQTIEAYARADSYQDRAYVRLLYTLDGKPVEDRAPLEVALDRGVKSAVDSGLSRSGPAALGLRVYSVQAGPTSASLHGLGDPGRWHIRVDEPPSSGAGSVTISRKSPKVVSMDWLLAEPWAVDRLSAGLVGFPLQLKLLLTTSGLPHTRLAGTPLELLANQGRLRAPARVDGHLCDCIAATVSGGTIAAWIDQETKLLRRIQFPQSSLPSQMREDTRLTDVQLTIEFEAARVGVPVSPASYHPAFDPQSLYLTQFVSAPPALDMKSLGQRVPAFFLEDAEKRVALKSSETNRDGKILALAWLANHPASKATSDQLKHVEGRLQAEAPELAGRVQFVSIWAEPSPPAGLRFENLASSWRLPGVLTIDRRAMGRDLFGVQEAPTVVVLDSKNRVQARLERGNPVLEQILPELLQRLAVGEDVAASTKMQQDQSLRQYAATVHRSVAPENVAPLPEDPSQYLPASFALQSTQRISLPGRTLVAFSGGQAGTWRLDSQGDVELIAPSGDVSRAARVNQIARAEDVLFAAQDDNRIAVANRNSNAVEIVDFGAAENVKAESLQAGFEVTGLQWLTLSGGQTTQLAMFGRDRIALVELGSKRRLEAPLPVGAVSLITSTFDRARSQNPVLLLESGDLEPLQLSGAVAESKSLESLPCLPTDAAWTTVDRGSSQPLHFGIVKLAGDEPAAMLLDSNLRPVWHHRLPSGRASQAKMMGGVAVGGEAVFALAESDGTVSVFRTQALASGDGEPMQVIADSFRVDVQLVGFDVLSGSASQRTISLRAISETEMVEYSLTW